MSVFDKIKNALFEEEYVEIEEKPKKKKVKEKPKREVSKVAEEKPIAKKVVLPEKKEESFEEEQVRDKVLEEEKEEFKFPMLDDSDFSVEDNYTREEPEIVKVIGEQKSHDLEYYDNYPRKDNLYQGKTSKPLYGIDEDDKIKVHEYGTYDKHEEKKSFKPSPIISPIYGVLDKNYKKEEIVTKKEVRLTSSYARENLSVDDVRKKAYGTLSDDLAMNIDQSTREVDDIPEKEENLFVDLSSTEEKPHVHEVTMGDAEEYFQDLGLEYNIDYKDATKEKATGRREKDHYEEIIDNKEESIETDINTEISKSEEEDSSKVKENNDDNLFDLIDSMYEEEN